MALDEALLALLRDRVGTPELTYAEAPRRLGGGFYTENHVFRLDGAKDEWDRPLVARLFPSNASAGLATREATVQNCLVVQGFPTAPVLLVDEDTAPLGRSFLIMDFLAGHAMMGEVGLRQLIRSSVPLLIRLPPVVADTQARLHQADPAPLVAELGARAAGVDRWLDLLEDRVAIDAPELGEPLRWLVDHRPEPRADDVVCHGDLWPGNMLVDHGQVVAVLDWTLATVAEPALEVGFTSMALTVAPLDLPGPVESFVLWGAAKVARRYVATYQRVTGADLTNQPWYEALRCILELTTVIEYRRATLEGRTLDTPRPTWDMASDRMVEYFRARTGVTPHLPPPI